MCVRVCVVASPIGPSFLSLIKFLLIQFLWNLILNRLVFADSSRTRAATSANVWRLFVEEMTEWEGPKIRLGLPMTKLSHNLFTES